MAGLDQRQDVAAERQRHDVGVEAVEHRARLLAGAAVRLLDRHGVAGLGLVLGDELVVDRAVQLAGRIVGDRSEEHTSELQSLMRISYAVFCLKKKKTHINYTHNTNSLHTNNKNTSNLIVNTNILTPKK